MVQDVRLLQITSEDHLKEINRYNLNFENRLENWLENDISMISDELMVIGRQVKTDFGGAIDLLCLNINGDVVIIELKRDKTPREITAQALDYASWIKDLDADKIADIANEYLNINLEDAYRNKFGEDIPDDINERHKILIVASEIDSSSERIIKYLSDTYGEGINAITFHYFKSEKGSICVLYPPESNEDKDLFAKVYLDRFASYFNYNDKEEVAKLFPEFDNREFHEWAAGEIRDVYFKNEYEVENLLAELPK